MNTILEKYKKLIIQIATPYSTGTGFYVKGPNLIVTNEHIVRGNSEVVVEGILVKRQMAKVLFTNPKLDIALLESTTIDEMPNVLFSKNNQVKIGDLVVAIGHPFGLKLTVTQGIISNINHVEQGVGYYQHDAALNPGNSGGPLVNQTGSVVGLNSFIFQNADNIGFSLPSFQISDCIGQYIHEGHGRKGTVCINCENLVFEDTVEGQFCPFVVQKLVFPIKKMILKQ